MRNILAFTSVLALVVAAPATAEKPDDNNGNGNGKSRGEGKPPKEKGGNAGFDQGRQPDRKGFQRTDVREVKPDRRDKAISVRNENAVGRDKKEYKQSEKKQARYNGSSRNFDSRVISDETRRYDVRGASDRFRFNNDDDRRRFAVRYDQDYGPLSGFCPPGLAKKGNGCQPPGQAKKSNKNNGYYLTQYSRFRDGDWNYYNGYAYQSNGGSTLISAFLPIVGGALFTGNQWPTAYQDYNVPQYYDQFFGRNDNFNYRYADRTIFSVNPQDQAIQGIVALLTGNDFQVGQQMPAGYDAYNVPYEYRDQYYDQADARYRYSDGYVYQVDPKTSLIASVIKLIA